MIPISKMEEILFHFPGRLLFTPQEIEELARWITMQSFAATKEEAMSEAVVLQAACIVLTQYVCLENELVIYNNGSLGDVVVGEVEYESEAHVPAKTLAGALIKYAEALAKEHGHARD